jgi:hypothetical protein
LSKHKIRLVLAAVAAVVLAVLGAMTPASAASSGGASRAVAVTGSEIPYFHSSTVCAQTTAHGAAATACPAASVYTKWAHSSYSVNVPSKAERTASGAAVTPATSASCEIYVSDLSLQSGSIVGDTVNTCVGSFSYQYIGEQTWRSSWSGWRGYDPWNWTPDLTQNQINYEWFVHCNGPGTYDYIQAAYGAPDGIAGPTTLSLNSQRWACGANS